ncbi:hypothetical protein GCM10020254_14520 [Streptomyces goshikiensis]
MTKTASVPGLRRLLGLLRTPRPEVSQVDAQFDAVGQRLQAPGGVLAVQAQVQGEVVAGAGADHHEGQVVRHGHPGDQGLGPVTARDAEQVGAAPDGLPRQLDHVLRPVRIQHDDLRPQGPGPLREPELGDLPASRARVHDQERPLGPAGGVLGHGRRGVLDQRGPAREDGQRPQAERDQHDPQQPCGGVQGEHGERHGHQQQHGQHPDPAGMGEHPPHARSRERQPRPAHAHEHEADEPAEDHQHQQRRHTRGQ